VLKEASMRLDTGNPKLRAKLIQVASAGGIIAYSELMESCNIPDRFLLSHELGVIADDCAQRGEPLLVAVGVLKESSSPSGGFYEKAVEHAGFDGSTDEDERMRWWFSYLAQVHAYWRTHGGNAGG
jgi:hypothetical protein